MDTALREVEGQIPSWEVVADDGVDLGVALFQGTDGGVVLNICDYGTHQDLFASLTSDQARAIARHILLLTDGSPA